MYDFLYAKVTEYGSVYEMECVKPYVTEYVTLYGLDLAYEKVYGLACGSVYG